MIFNNMGLSVNVTDPGRSEYGPSSAEILDMSIGPIPPFVMEFDYVGTDGGAEIVWESLDES